MIPTKRLSGVPCWQQEHGRPELAHSKHKEFRAVLSHSRLADVDDASESFMTVRSILALCGCLSACPAVHRERSRTCDPPLACSLPGRCRLRFPSQLLLVRLPFPSAPIPLTQSWPSSCCPQVRWVLSCLLWRILPQTLSKGRDCWMSRGKIYGAPRLRVCQCPARLADFTRSMLCPFLSDRCAMFSPFCGASR